MTSQLNAHSGSSYLLLFLTRCSEAADSGMPLIVALMLIFARPLYRTESSEAMAGRKNFRSSTIPPRSFQSFVHCSCFALTGLRSLPFQLAVIAASCPRCRPQILYIPYSRLNETSLSSTELGCFNHPRPRICLLWRKDVDPCYIERRALLMRSNPEVLETFLLT